MHRLWNVASNLPMLNVALRAGALSMLPFLISADHGPDPQAEYQRQLYTLSALEQAVALEPDVLREKMLLLAADERAQVEQKSITELFPEAHSYSADYGQLLAIADDAAAWQAQVVHVDSAYVGELNAQTLPQLIAMAAEQELITLSYVMLDDRVEVISETALEALAAANAVTVHEIRKQWFSRTPVFGHGLMVVTAQNGSLQLLDTVSYNYAQTETLKSTQNFDAANSLYNPSLLERLPLAVEVEVPNEHLAHLISVPQVYELLE